MKAFLFLLPVFSVAHAALPDIDTTFIATTHKVPADPFKTNILFRGYVDTVTTAGGVKTLAKDWNDFNAYVPINGRSDSGYLIVSHEMIKADAILGDGGGMTVMSVARSKDGWKVVDHPKGKFRAIDFSKVGGTLANCGGAVLANGNVMTAEEWGQTSNAAIAALAKDPADTSKRIMTGITDTSDYVVKRFNGEDVNITIPRYKNFNWMVQVNPATGEAVRKHYEMGRFDHEGGVFMDDGKTVYLTDDFTPAVFFKFVAKTAGNYDVGQLYAYKQSNDGMTGSWIEMPMVFDSMLVARDVALRRGATTFTRHEWIDKINGKVYITETGRDKSAEHYKWTKKGATMAKHLRERLPAGTTVTLYNGETKGDSTVTDYYGRVLVFDPATDKMSVLLEGGRGVANTAKHLSNPDGLATARIGNRDYLFIQEDLNGLSQGRVSPEAEAAGRVICEAYLLDLAEPATIDNLKRVFVGPANSEVTGGIFTPDGTTMFINPQHPDDKLAAPYNTSYTVAVSGFDANTTKVLDRAPGRGKTLQIAIDPVGRWARFDRTIDVKIHDAQGNRLGSHQNVNALDLGTYQAGTYFLDAGKQGVHKIVIQ